MNSQRKTACAAAGLACAFGGTWTADAYIAALSGLDRTTLWMRISSLVIYCIAAIVVIAVVAALRARRANGLSADKRANAITCVGAVCLAISVACELALVAGATGAAAALCGFGMKIVGPSLTVALAYGFSRVQPGSVAKASFIGIAGAFLAENVFVWLGASGTWGPVFGLYAASVLEVVSLACSHVLLRQPCSVDDAIACPGDDSRIVAPRSLGGVFTAPFLVTIVATAAMLGFLHSGLHGQSEPSVSPSIVAALVLLCVAFVPRGVKISPMNLLMAGLVCVAAGFLIGPLVELLVPDAQAMLTSLGTAILESAAWVLTVHAARNSPHPLVAATVARLFTVAGHLVGALVASGMHSLATADTGSLQAGSLVIVFAYFLLALFLSRVPMDAVVEGGPSAVSEPLDTVGTELGSVEEKAEVSPEPLTDAQREQRALAGIADACQLTARERDVFARLAQGRDIGTIESELCISRNTAKMHIRNVYRKLQVHSKQELIDMVQSRR